MSPTFTVEDCKRYRPHLVRAFAMKWRETGNLSDLVAAVAGAYSMKMRHHLVRPPSDYVLRIINRNAGRSR